jgi:hypothetical protein
MVFVLLDLLSYISFYLWILNSLLVSSNFSYFLFINLYLLRPAVGQTFRASGDDHASTLVPPQFDSIRPIGLLIWVDRYFPNNQQTAEKDGNEPVIIVCTNIKLNI